MKKTLRFALLVLSAFFLFSCAPAKSPETGSTASRDIVARDSAINFQVDKDGPSKRVTWVSRMPAPEDTRICFEHTTGYTVICNDVEAGKISGVLYAFGSMDVENSKAVFVPSH